MFGRSVHSGGNGTNSGRSVVVRTGLILAWTLAATWLGLRLGHPWLLPILQTLPLYGFMLSLLVRGHWRGAIAWMLVWALALAVVVPVLVWQQPERAGRVILRGEWYRSMMFAWLCTGVGMESDPGRFIPWHLREIALFTGASLLTLSLVSMHGGTVLMNYMGYYVGSLMALSDRPMLVLAVAWKVYALIRVVSFVILGVLLAEPLLYRLLRRSYSFRERRMWFLAAAVGLVLDIGLKTLLAPLYQQWLMRLVRLPCP